MSYFSILDCFSFREHLFLLCSIVMFVEVKIEFSMSISGRTMVFSLFFIFNRFYRHRSLQRHLV